MLATVVGWVPELQHLSVSVHNEDESTSSAFFKVAGVRIPQLSVSHLAVKQYVSSHWMGHVVHVAIVNGPDALEYARITRVFDDANLGSELLRFGLRDDRYALT